MLIAMEGPEARWAEPAVSFWVCKGVQYEYMHTLGQQSCLGMGLPWNFSLSIGSHRHLYGSDQGFHVSVRSLGLMFLLILVLVLILILVFVRT